MWACVKSGLFQISCLTKSRLTIHVILLGSFQTMITVFRSRWIRLSFHWSSGLLLTRRMSSKLYRRVSLRKAKFQKQKGAQKRRFRKKFSRRGILIRTLHLKLHLSNSKRKVSSIPQKYSLRNRLRSWPIFLITRKQTSRVLLMCSKWWIRFSNWCQGKLRSKKG